MTFLNPSCKAGFLILEYARRHAEAIDGDPWEFAVTVDELQEWGFESNDVLWLVRWGVLLHRRATQMDGDVELARRSIPDHGNAINAQSIFILSDDGRQFATTTHEERASILKNVGLPRWDPSSRTLRYDGKIVKAFRVPAPNQELILSAFEEQGWRLRIDDPLPPSGKIDPKRRLNETIRSLNRHQGQRLLQFSGDGTGQGVLWNPLEPGVPRSAVPQHDQTNRNSYRSSR